MVKLNAGLLDRALEAIKTHGYGSFFPEPPEFGVVDANWSQVREELAQIDLDVYEGYEPIRLFAPKSRLNVRWVALLHPFDLIFYTALVLALRDDISASRLPAREKRVFSYRAEGAKSGVLYNVKQEGFRKFKERVAKWGERNPNAFVGLADIADFYPRIYQHRLKNALLAASDQSRHPYIRALEKLLTKFSEGGVSYGVPVGPAASRLLGEAVLIDIDNTLISYDIDFARFVDDFVIFADRPEETEHGIRVLGETLFVNHGLTLQTSKTRILPIAEYLEKHLTAHSEKEQARRALLALFGDDYEVKRYEDLTDAEKKEVDAFNLSEMLAEALAEGEHVDFREVSFILGRLSALQKPELIPIVLDSLERLYPVAHSIAAFFKGFQHLDPSTRRKVARTILKPILEDTRSKPSEYYCMWTLSVFQHAST
jgi:hypothetical protein